MKRIHIFPKKPVLVLSLFFTMMISTFLIFAVSARTTHSKTLVVPHESTRATTYFWEGSYWEFVEKDCDSDWKRCPKNADTVEHKFIFAQTHDRVSSFGFTCEHQKFLDGTEENIIRFGFESAADRLSIRGDTTRPYRTYDIDVLVNGSAFSFPMEYKNTLGSPELTKSIDFSVVAERDLINEMLDGDTITFDGRKFHLKGSKTVIEKLFEICG